MCNASTVFLVSYFLNERTVAWYGMARLAWARGWSFPFPFLLFICRNRQSVYFESTNHRSEFTNSGTHSPHEQQSISTSFRFRYLCPFINPPIARLFVVINNEQRTGQGKVGSLKHSPDQAAVHDLAREIQQSSPLPVYDCLFVACMLHKVVA